MGADVYAQSKYSYTPLHYACLGGNFAVVEHLVKENADILALNDNNDTPLRLARNRRHNHIVKFLEEELSPE